MPLMVIRSEVNVQTVNILTVVFVSCKCWTNIYGYLSGLMAL